MMRDELEVIDGGLAPASQSLDRRRSIDLDAEAAVIGNLVLDASMIAEVRGWLEPAHFYAETHRRIFEVVLALSDADKPIDVVTIMTALRANGRLAQVGGAAALTDLMNAVPALNRRHLRSHARTVRDLWARRQLGTIAMRAQSRTENDSAGVEVLLSETRAEIDELAAQLSTSERCDRIDAVAERVFQEISARANNAVDHDGRAPGPTGFDRLDRLLAPIAGELSLVAGRPGTGKTSFAIAVALHNARTVGGVMVSSLETGEGPLLSRTLGAIAGVEARRVMTGALSSAEWNAVTDACAEITKLPIWLDTTPAISVAELWAKARRRQLELQRGGGRLALVVIDYVQLVRPARAGMKREEAVAENARALKAMAGDLRCAVLGLSQLNRAADARQDKRPQLSDLRESGELEQCARLVLMLHREDMHRSREPAYRRTGTAEVFVAKQNNGPAGHVVKLGFDEPTTRFYELAEDER
jgi:replicative DNA helicase